MAFFNKNKSTNFIVKQKQSNVKVPKNKSNTFLPVDFLHFLFHTIK